MNPWALLVILLGITLLIIGIKGSQHQVGSAITGKSAQQPVTPSSGGKGKPLPIVPGPPLS